MIKVLWLAPNFNHYKASFLDQLAKDPRIDLTILAGSDTQNGHKEIDRDWSYKLHRIGIDRKNYGNSSKVRTEIRKIFQSQDWILIPAEKKNLYLFVYLLWLRYRYPGTKLFSYNHTSIKSGKGYYRFLNKALTKFFYRKLDRVIFYTKQSCSEAIRKNLVSPAKAYWANNTLDSREIQKYYSFVYPSEELRILFIGRLVPSKDVDLAIEYYSRIKQNFHPKKVFLDIIGDGPDRHIVEKAVVNNNCIKWHGTIVDEREITKIMKKVSLVFLPGASGLSINHAFAYGRPYVTIDSAFHGPEISYLKNNINGFLLSKSQKENIEILTELLTDKKKLGLFCVNSFDTGKELSIDYWIQQMVYSLSQ